MDKKVALKDIALKAGVSVALVSYVLNGKEKAARISSAMAESIRKIADELNYQPNLLAKSLKSGRSNTIGLIVADISNPFFSGIARIVEDEARRQGYVVIFGSSDENAAKQQDLLNVFTNRQVDAFIIAAADGTEEQVNALAQKNVPVVLIDRYFASNDLSSVRMDNFSAAEQATNLLIANGRKRVAMLSYNTQAPHIQHRVDGYKHALQNNNIAFNESRLVRASYQNIEADVQENLSKLLKPLQVDAIFFATNSLAVAALKLISSLCIKVPEDVAIISFDESDAFDFFYSPISYVSQSIEEIGRQAVSIAIAKLNGLDTTNRTVVIQPKLVIRQSCG